MFIYNVKVNGSRLFKIFFVAMLIILFFIICIVIFKIFNGAATNSESISSCLPQKKVNKINTGNYTNILKTVHENIDNYVGIQINFTGYIYRVLDLKDNQFILARDMIVSSDFKSVIVGFLCECDNAKAFENNTWVELTGKIVKGNYHGNMPIVKVTEINKIDKPNDEYVYPPDENYIPTSNII